MSGGDNTGVLRGWLQSVKLPELFFIGVHRAAHRLTEQHHQHSMCGVLLTESMGAATFQWVTLPGVTPPSRRQSRGRLPRNAG